MTLEIKVGPPWQKIVHYHTGCLGCSESLLPHQKLPISSPSHLCLSLFLHRHHPVDNLATR